MTLCHLKTCRQAQHMDYYTTTKEIFIPELLLLWTGEMVKITPLRTLAYGDMDAAMGKTWDASVGLKVQALSRHISTRTSKSSGYVQILVYNRAIPPDTQAQS